MVADLEMELKTIGSASCSLVMEEITVTGYR